MVEKKMNEIENFYSEGYCVIDDFLDHELANKLLKTFKSINKWHRIDQIRSHYEKEGPFEMKSIFFPGHHEKYYLKGWRAKDFELEKNWKSYFNNEFVKKIEKLFNKNVLCDTTYVLKYSKNDFSRIHIDDLRGDVNRVDISILYYSCDQWVWDWGGILMLGKSIESEDMVPILPRNNRLILLNNQMKLPHCVTPVAEYAKCDRFAIASFIGCDKPFVEK